MGVILGTAAYMSPEQAKGKTADRRSDVWAFGAVLYEMLSGRRAFVGEDVSDTLVSVFRDDPDWSRLSDEVPARVRQAIKVCLQKDPKQRVRDVAAVRLAMEGAFETTVSMSSEQVVAPQLQVWQRPVPAAMVALVFAAVAGLAVWALTRPAPDRVVRVSLPLAGDLTFSGIGRPVVAVAPRGDRVAYTADGGLWLRPLDRMDATLVSGSEGARNPFFSADGTVAWFLG